MTHQEYIRFHSEICNKMNEITVRKNADYSGASTSPFFNVEKIEKKGLVSTEMGLLVRINDKLSRIENFILKGEYKVKEESLEDTIIDANNYLIMLLGYIKSNRIERE